MAAKAIMIQGTMSNAGKSVLTAGLCRIFRQDGYSVAPFKSQNMALNSFVTREGLEMGRAQVMQAEAAGVEPSVRMNPILLKPSSDMGSQVIVNGEVLGDMRASDYFRHKKELVPQILASYRSLAEEHDGLQPRRALTLSQGTADQLYLAVRLAVCELVLPAEEPCPLVLDDALANFDDGRCALALEALARLGEERQILLFTCHSREARLAEGREGAAVLRLQS
mgnify:CR=1 FL=1